MCRYLFLKFLSKSQKSNEFSLKILVNFDSDDYCLYFDSSTDDNSTGENEKEEDETIVEVSVNKNDVIKNPEPEAQKIPQEEILKELYFEDHSQPCKSYKHFLEAVKMQNFQAQIRIVRLIIKF